MLAAWLRKIVARGVTVRRSGREKKRVTFPPIEHLKALLAAPDRGAMKIRA
jgi:hypothetical protein